VFSISLYRSFILAAAALLTVSGANAEEIGEVSTSFKLLGNILNHWRRASVSFGGVHPCCSRNCRSFVFLIPYGIPSFI